MTSKHLKHQIRVKIGNFLSQVTLKFDGCMNLKNNRAPVPALCIISYPSVNSNWSYSPETPNSGQDKQFFVPCDLEIWWMTLKNNGAPLVYYIKLCASFQSHLWIQTNLSYSSEKLNSGQNRKFFVPCDLEIWRMTLKKTIGHLFYAASSFVNHFKAIVKFKLKLQSGNAQIVSK